VRGVNIFTVVVVVTTSVFVSDEEREVCRIKYLKMTVGLSSSRRSWEVSGLSNVW
jgi:hypothetical protein